MRQIELLSPAGDFETALSAFEAGADAVYCGLQDFSARAFAKNFSFEDLRHIVAYAHAKGRKVYVTFNTVLDEADVDAAIETLARLEEIAPDALIVQDLGVVRICRRHFPGLALHASTQLVAHNLEGVLAMKALGFTRVVLARELSVEEIASIAKRCGGMELECFIHGALCYSISGLCLFSAMEKGRSGNRGRCAYCCRLPYADETGGKTLAFSMKDMRVGEDVRKLVDAGVASLKIEGRMKSALYVASATSYYRALLDGRRDGAATLADLETVFSRRTTDLYLNGPREDVIDPVSLGHLGTPVGTIKRITKDRDGRSWLRFHTARALERHDGLQFAAPDGGKPLGFGISEMRQAISRANVFEVSAGSDVEILLPEDGDTDWTNALRSGDTVYCSMSNAVKRKFPSPSFRPSEYPGGTVVDVTVGLSGARITASAEIHGRAVCCVASGDFAQAKNPEKTYAAVKKAFSKLGETDYRLGRLVLDDPERRFAPMRVLNDLRRDLVERLDAAACDARRSKIEAAQSDVECVDLAAGRPRRTVKLRAGQKLPEGDWDEVVVAVSPGCQDVGRYPVGNLRLALPVYTAEPEFGKLRVMVKRLVREGFLKWEASDLATLSLLKSAGIRDITADWTLYAFNSRSLAELASLGVGRFVASPENSRENMQYLAESGYDVEFLSQQSTPLFISMTKPASEKVDGFAVYRRDGLWVTTRPVTRTFDLPEGVSTRIDLSWEAP
jgi:putative protease